MPPTSLHPCGFCQTPCQRSCLSSVQHAIGTCPECGWPIYIEDGDACDRCGLKWADRPECSPAVQLLDRWYATPDTSDLDEEDFPALNLSAQWSHADRELARGELPPDPDLMQRALLLMICQVLASHFAALTWQEDVAGFALYMGDEYYGHVTCDPLPTKAPVPEQDLAGALLRLIKDVHARRQEA
jgi:hypothetical protein